MTHTPRRHAPGRSRWPALAGFLAFTFLAAVGGFFTETSAGSWYDSLTKPPWNPPSWVFGPVWTALYITIAVSGWLVWSRPATDEHARARRRSALVLWLVQWALNAAWTPIFFVAQRPGLALVEIALLWCAIVATVALSWRVRAAAGIILLPYLAWVTFAAALNASIWSLNR